jgi:hypothetical protein
VQATLFVGVGIIYILVKSASRIWLFVVLPYEKADDPNEKWLLH